MPIPQDTAPLARPNAKERILQTLSAWLVDGTLEPGERLYDEELSRYFEVSRTPVREALQVLAEKGLVEILPGRGTRVAPIDPEELRQSYPLLSHLHGFAVRLAFDKIDEEVLARLEERNQVLYRLLKEGTLPQIQEADRLFHQEFIDLAANKYLAAVIDDLSLHIYRSETQFFKKREFRGRSLAGHEKILAALRARDLEGAVSAAEENWMLNFHLVIEALLPPSGQK